MTYALVISGSANEERDFGLASGVRVAQALRDRGWQVDEADGGEPKGVIEAIKSLTSNDVVVPVGFGAGGCEDGFYAGISRIYGIPCTGPSTAAGEVCLNKHLFESVVAGLFTGVPHVATPNGTYIHRYTTIGNAAVAIRRLRPPLIVKPNFGGSSIHLTVCETHDRAIEVAVHLSQEASAVLVQEIIAPAAEISVTVIDIADGRRVLPIVELVRDGTVFTYEEKFGPTASQRHRIPALISPQTAARAESVVRIIHEAIGLHGLARYDLLVQDEQIIILECNAIPGLTRTSIACDAARAAGYTFEEFVELYVLAAFLPRVEAPLFWDQTNEPGLRIRRGSQSW